MPTANDNTTTGGAIFVSTDSTHFATTDGVNSTTTNDGSNFTTTDGVNFTDLATNVTFNVCQWVAEQTNTSLSPRFRPLSENAAACWGTAAGTLVGIAVVTAAGVWACKNRRQIEDACCIAGLKRLFGHDLLGKNKRNIVEMTPSVTRGTSSSVSGGR